MLPNASEFLANANLLKIAFGRAFAREIRYMGEQYKDGILREKILQQSKCGFIMYPKCLSNNKCMSSVSVGTRKALYLSPWFPTWSDATLHRMTRCLNFRFSKYNRLFMIHDTKLNCYLTQFHYM